MKSEPSLILVAAILPASNNFYAHIHNIIRQHNFFNLGAKGILSIKKTYYSELMVSLR